MNRIKNYFTNLGLSYIRELFLITFSNVVMLFLMIILFIFTKSNLVIIGGIFCLLIVNFLFVYRYSNLKIKIINNHNDEFVNIFSYFRIYIESGFNVYNAIKMLIPYSSNWMRDKIELLLRDIDEDKSIKPFITFSKYFTNIRIESVLTSIYQMIDVGESNSSNNEFGYIFSQVYEQERIELLHRKQKSLDSLSSLPLIGAAIITLLLTIGIVFIIGELINGI